MRRARFARFEPNSLREKDFGPACNTDPRQFLFLAATSAGQWTLARHDRPLVARSARHRVACASWAALYTFVAIQLAWVLRPFVGTPDMPTRFFREEAWSNA